ncbi:unnamed protein product [Adineta ricciae]|uniref:Uncharacterized protein n=1 Tax=Adineta ricciae TaxID=249248 RepID=A0A815R2F1_ADIRI|nr:unnamed protein product [Adineta ricciae]CAF1471218.1 unnamed protein product [Adineta ricciae]
MQKIISNVPQLRRLSLNDVSHISSIIKLNNSFTLNHLTHLFLKLNRVCFNDLELFIQKYFRSIEVLRISIKAGDEYLNANRWERLITSSLPSLRVFDIYIEGFSYQAFVSRCEEFQSLFWTKRQ